MFFNIMARPSEKLLGNGSSKWMPFKLNLPEDVIEIVISSKEAEQQEFKVELHVHLKWVESQIACWTPYGKYFYIYYRSHEN